MDGADAVFAGEFVVGDATDGIGSKNNGFFDQFVVLGTAVDAVLRESDDL